MRADQVKHQVRCAGMIDPHPHLHVSHVPVVGHHNGRAGDGIVLQTQRVGRQIRLRPHRRGVLVDACQDIETGGRRVGIEHADEITAGIQWGNVARTDRQRAARRIDQRRLVEIARRRLQPALDIQIYRPAVIGNGDGQFAAVGRHVHKVIVPLIGRHANAQLRPQNGSVGLDTEGEAVHPAGAAAAVIGHGQQPRHRAGGAFTHEVVQASRPVGRSAEQEQPAEAVVIHQVEERAGHAAITVVVVQDREMVGETEVAQQIATGLVGDIVGHDDSSDGYRLARINREHDRPARRLR